MCEHNYNQNSYKLVNGRRIPTNYLGNVREDVVRANHDSGSYTVINGERIALDNEGNIMLEDDDDDDDDQ